MNQLNTTLRNLQEKSPTSAFFNLNVLNYEVCFTWNSSFFSNFFLSLFYIVKRKWHIENTHWINISMDAYIRHNHRWD